jgi:hypothetical protein
MAEQDAAKGLAAALQEQARLGDALSRAAGTSSEFAAFARLEDATRRVSEWNRLLAEQREQLRSEPEPR